MAVIPPYSFNEGLGNLTFLNPPSFSWSLSFTFFQAAFSQTPPPFPSSQACLLQCTAIVCLSCDDLSQQIQLGSFPPNFAFLPFLQDTPLFLSGGEQSALPLIPETLQESLALSCCCGPPWLSCCSWLALACSQGVVPAGRLHSQLSLFPVLPDMSWWRLESH